LIMLEKSMEKLC